MQLLSSCLSPDGEKSKDPIGPENFEIIDGNRQVCGVFTRSCELDLSLSQLEVKGNAVCRVPDCVGL